MVMHSSVLMMDGDNEKNVGIGCLRGRGKYVVVV